MKTIINKVKLLCLLFTVILISSCGNDFLDVSPSTNAGDANLINNADDLRTATNGTYETLTSSAY